MSVDFHYFTILFYYLFHFIIYIFPFSHYFILFVLFMCSISMHRALDLACIDQQWPIDVCHHSIVLQSVVHISSKLEQVLHMSA